MCLTTSLRRLLALSLVLLATKVHAGPWQETTINGRGYVSVESMKPFYHFDRLTVSGKTILLENKKIELRMTAGGYDCLMNGVKFVFSYPVESSAGKYWISKIDLTKLVDPVLRPTFIQSAGNFRTVIVDAGHGGKDSGAANSLGTEARYNLNLANLLKLELEKLQYRVVMTRDTNEYLTLQQRVNLANRVTENAIFISIHHNSGQRAARGIETFTLSPVGVSHYGRGLKASDFSPNTGNFHDSANVALATAVHGMILYHLKDPKTKQSYTLDRGIKRARFSVLSGVKHPSILVECGFMSHNYEARLINDAGYQRTLVKSMVMAINNYRRAVGGNQPQQ